mmetsp:Transcript_12163/g.45144  ORF Transcript_12163/g.45144 Transcript_12163/m.45144 type:complete len:557 (-) Transcript_12163:180-1850(-)
MYTDLRSATWLLRRRGLLHEELNLTVWILHHQGVLIQRRRKELLRGVRQGEREVLLRLRRILSFRTGQFDLVVLRVGFVIFRLLSDPTPAPPPEVRLPAESAARAGLAREAQGAVVIQVACRRAHRALLHDRVPVRVVAWPKHFEDGRYLPILFLRLLAAPHGVHEEVGRESPRPVEIPKREDDHQERHLADNQGDDDVGPHVQSSVLGGQRDYIQEPQQHEDAEHVGSLPDGLSKDWPSVCRHEGLDEGRVPQRAPGAPQQLLERKAVEDQDVDQHPQRAERGAPQDQEDGAPAVEHGHVHDDPPPVILREPRRDDAVAGCAHQQDRHAERFVDELRVQDRDAQPEVAHAVQLAAVPEDGGQRHHGGLGDGNDRRRPGDGQHVEAQPAVVGDDPDQQAQAPQRRDHDVEDREHGEEGAFVLLQKEVPTRDLQGALLLGKRVALVEQALPDVAMHLRELAQLSARRNGARVGFGQRAVPQVRNAGEEPQQLTAEWSIPTSLHVGIQRRANSLIDFFPAEQSPVFLSKAIGGGLGALVVQGDGPIDAAALGHAGYLR